MAKRGFRTSPLSRGNLNPILSKAIDTNLTECFTALEGKEFADIFVPFWKDIIHKQDSKIVQAFLAHMYKMFVSVEVSVMQKFHQEGAKEIALTLLEVEKAKLFAIRLQDRDDKDTAIFFEVYKLLIREILDGAIQPDDSSWEVMIEEIQCKALEYANKLSPEQLTGSAIGIIRSTATYYMEELATASESSVEYDPIYSLPPGVQPSEVLKIRMEKWKTAKSREMCKCDFRKTLNQEQMQQSMLIVIPSSKPTVLVTLQRLIHNAVAVTVNALLSDPIPQPLYTPREDPPSEAVVKTCNSIDSFINKLFSLTIDEASDDIVEVALSFIKELIENGLFKIATSFLVTLLHGTVALSHFCQNRAYHHLVRALTSIREGEDTVSFDKWFLKVFCEYISTQSELSNLPTTIINLINFLFREKTKELLSVATDSVCSKEASCVLEPALRLYQSQIGLLPMHHATQSAIQFLNGLLRAKLNKRDALDTIMQEVWKNPDLCDVAAKVVAFLLPYNYLNMITCTRTLVIPSKECDIELYKCEREIEDKVMSNEMSVYDAALWYLDLMIDDQFIHHSHQKVLCLLKAAYYFAIGLKKISACQESMQFAFKNAITLLAYDASQLALASLQPGSRIFALTTAYELTCLAANISDPLQHSCLSGRVACGLLKKLIHSSQFTYLLSQPMALHDFWVASASYINKISNSAQQAYIQQLLQIPEQSLPLRRALLHYQSMETCIRKGQLEGPHFNEKRLVAMSKLLSETKWTFDDVSKAMTTTLLQRNGEGFIKLQESLGEHLEIAELKGVVFNYNEHSPSIQVVIKPAKDGDGLLSYRDIIELLQLNSDETSKIIFSLDPPSGTEQYHPFMKMRCYPGKLQDTEFMQSLFHADYILKFLATGVEVSAKHPFNFKPVQESLINNLPDSLDFLHHPPYSRVASHMASHRFWIEAEEVSYDEDVTDSQVIYYIDNVKIQVKSRPLVVTLNGNTIDAKHSEYGPHAQFAHKFTERYEDISKHFRIFARVKELSKLQFVVQKHHTQLKSLKEKSPKCFESFCREVDRLHSLHPIESNPDSCLWVPATYNNFVYGGVLFTPKSSHLEYLRRSGADIPSSCFDAHAALDFSVAHKFMQTVKPSLEGVGVGGIKIEIQYQHKTAVSQPDIGFVCVMLGDTPRSSQEDSSVQASHGEGDEVLPVASATLQPKQRSACIDQTLTEPIQSNIHTSDMEIMYSKELERSQAQERSESSDSTKHVENDDQLSKVVVQPELHLTKDNNQDMGCISAAESNSCPLDDQISSASDPKSLLFSGEKQQNIREGTAANANKSHSDESDLTQMSPQKLSSNDDKSVGAISEGPPDYELNPKHKVLSVEHVSQSSPMKDNDHNSACQSAYKLDSQNDMENETQTLDQKPSSNDTLDKPAEAKQERSSDYDPKPKVSVKPVSEYSPMNIVDSGTYQSAPADTSLIQSTSESNVESGSHKDTNEHQQDLSKQQCASNDMQNKFFGAKDEGSSVYEVKPQVDVLLVKQANESSPTKYNDHNPSYQSASTTESNHIQMTSTADSKLELLKDDNNDAQQKELSEDVPDKLAGAKDKESLDNEGMIEHEESLEMNSATYEADHNSNPSLPSSASDSKSVLSNETYPHIVESTAAYNVKTSTPPNQSTHNDDEEIKDSTPEDGITESENVTLESESEPKSGSDSKFNSDQNHAKMQSRFSVEFDVESVLSHAAKDQILFLRKGGLKNTLSTEFRQSLVNQAVFGRMLNDHQFDTMLRTTFDFNENSFHHNILACHLIKTAIVLRKLVEHLYKRGNEKQILS